MEKTAEAMAEDESLLQRPVTASRRLHEDGVNPAPKYDLRKQTNIVLKPRTTTRVQVATGKSFCLFKP